MVFPTPPSPQKTDTNYVLVCVCVCLNRTSGGWFGGGFKITRRCTRFVHVTGAIVHEAQKGFGPSGRVHRIAAGGRVSPATDKFRPGPADTGTRTTAVPVVCTPPKYIVRTRVRKIMKNCPRGVFLARAAKREKRRTEHVTAGESGHAPLCGARRSVPPSPVRPVRRR